MNVLKRWLQSDVGYSFRQSPMAMVAAAIAFICLFCSVFAGWVSPTNPFDLATLELSDARLPPAWMEGGTSKFLLGTDDQGRDMVVDAGLAVDQDGKFLGMRVHTHANLGSYLSTFASAVPTILYATLLADVRAGLTGVADVAIVGIHSGGAWLAQRLAADLGLTPREFEVLLVLAKAAGKPLARNKLYREAWGYEMMAGDRSVDVFVRKVRQKLKVAIPGTEFVVTHYGVGYRFDPTPEGTTD